MPTNKLILYYLDKITNQDALEFCRRNNWDFSNEEISLILKFARKYRFYINLESKNYLLSEFKKVADDATFNKVNEIYNKFF